MRARIPSILLLLVVSLLPGGLRAQDVPPANLAEVETARSRTCVASLARLAALDSALTPYAQRIQRINTVGRAVSLEKRSDAEPLDPTDPVESKVAEWFGADSALASRFIASKDSALLVQRREARTAILDWLRQTLQATSDTAQAKVAAEASVEEEAQGCVGAILVRAPVLEACATTPSPVCEAARQEEGEATTPYRFVDDAADLWAVEQYGPWTKAGPLALAPDGTLAGARTASRARRGNVIFSVALAPLIRARSQMDEEDLAWFQANLDSLGFTFDHPRLILAPAIELQANLPAPLGGEDLYVLHFGDLTGDDVIWSGEAGTGGMVQTAFPATKASLERLRAGEIVSLTAVRTPEVEGGDAEAIFTVSLLQVGQAPNIDALLGYMSGGGLNMDLKALVPPGGGSPPRG